MSPSFFKRGGSAAVNLIVATKHEINQYAQSLSGQGYQLVGTPIEYRQQMTQSQLRDSVKSYAHQNGCKLVVEVQDPNPMANPFNPYKYYLFQYTGAGEPPEPQKPASQAGSSQLDSLTSPRDSLWSPTALTVLIVVPREVYNFGRAIGAFRPNCW